MSKGIDVKTYNEVMDALDTCINAGKVLGINFNDDDGLRIELDLGSAGNCFDSSSLESLLKTLKKLGVVSEKVKTIWFGLNNYKPLTKAKFKLWCAV